MPKLNDRQSILLATATQRDSGSLYPLPEATAAAGARLTKAITALIKAGFADERDTSDQDAAHRIDGNLRYGVFITPAGSNAIGVGDEPDDVISAAATQPTAPIHPPRPSKTSAVVALLQREDGATLAELIATTGWLPHTTRAALTGLRKKGHAIDRGKRGDTTCYRITAGGGMSALEQKLAALTTMSSAQLRDEWQALVSAPVPRISPSLLRLALAWEIQACSLGGLSRATTQALEQAGRGLTRTSAATAGMRLVREWNGRVYVVTIGEDQVIRWDDREWRSLSEVARAITGTRWSGPAFFGLKKKVAA